MKKERITVIIGVVMIGIAFIGGYRVLNTFFPMADPIALPAEKHITAVTVYHNDGGAVSVDTERFGALLQSVSEAQPTRTVSVNDYPAVKPYYEIKLSTSEREYRYYLYTDNAHVYIEIPYEGVYKSSQTFYDDITAYFKN